MARIKGIEVTLIRKVETGKDSFDNPLYDEKAEIVKNVLVAPATTEEIVDSLNLWGKKAVYNIAIPKGDTNVWQDQAVEFFGERWQVIGFPEQGIEENIPLEWNQKWKVARYE